MNYPVWQLPFPGGALIALVAILHVFVSHFAIGGGAFLVLSERRAYRNRDSLLLAYVQRHSRFFALLTLVFGAVSGVGIWFTIGLVSPEATSSLIHTFVWGWAIEWVFFFVEIAAAIIYYYSWGKLSQRDHMAIGWIYFVSAWMSLAVINGIIAFMLTPGTWLQTRRFADGFFNPTYLPSLIFRTAICVVLAGVFGLVTGARDKTAGRENIIRWAAQWIVVGALLLPALAAWYYSRVPGFSKTYLSGILVTAQHIARTGIACAALLLLLALIFGIWKPRLMRTPAVAVLVLLGFGLIASVEYLREIARKPWAINGYLYANDLPASAIERYREAGVLATAKFPSSDDPGSLAYGRFLYQAQCAKCHSLDGWRGMRPRVRGWDAPFAAEMLTHLEVTRGTMAPFAGNEQDRNAFGRYLASLNTPLQLGAGGGNLQGGELVFQARCGSCHTIDGKFRPLNKALAGAAPEQIEALLPVLDSMNPNMPHFSAPDDQAHAMAVYMAHALAQPAAKETR